MDYCILQISSQISQTDSQPVNKLLYSQQIQCWCSHGLGISSFWPCEAAVGCDVQSKLERNSHSTFTINQKMVFWLNCQEKVLRVSWEMSSYGSGKPSWHLLAATERQSYKQCLCIMLVQHVIDPAWLDFVVHVVGRNRGMYFSCDIYRFKIKIESK